MLTTIRSSRYRRAASIALGFAALWIVFAFIRSGTTFHLAPVLVAATVSVVFAYDARDRVTTAELAIASLAGLAIALLTTLVLALVDQMTGPSLLPFGGGVTESVIFAAVGAIAGFGIGVVLRSR